MIGKLDIKAEPKPIYGLFFMNDKERTPSEHKSLKKMGISREKMEGLYKEGHGWIKLGDDLEKATKLAKNICNILHCGMIITQREVSITYTNLSFTEREVWKKREMEKKI